MAFELNWGSFKMQFGKERQQNVPPQSEEQEYKAVGEKLNPAEARQMQELIDSIVMPVKSERSTIPGHTTLFEMVKQMVLIEPSFQLELIGAIENLAMFNPEVSNAIENISLANTPHTIYFPDSIPDTMQKKMIDHLKRTREKWYRYSYGVHGLTNDFLAQAGTAGALSFEAVPNRKLTGIDYVALVSPKHIWFDYDRESGIYTPVQKIPENSNYQGIRLQGQYKRLNEATYKYIAMRRIGDSPYAIPPFLSALEDILIQKDMVKNLRTIIGKLGLLGFLKVLLNKPNIKNNEGPEAYQARLDMELGKNIAEIKKGFLSGFLASYDDSQADKNAGKANGPSKIEMTPTVTNTTGAEAIINVVGNRVQLGLKQDPAMAGAGTQVTETFGRVILAKMTTQLSTYQYLTASGFNFLYWLELTLAGYKVPYVETEFEPVMLGDKAREEEAYSLKIENNRKLYQDGIINQQQRSSNLSYEEPDMDEPRPLPEPAAPAGGGAGPAKKPSNGPSNPTPKVDATDPKTTKAKNTANWYAAFEKLGGNLKEFNYQTEHICSGGEHDSGLSIMQSWAKDNKPDFWDEYNAESQKVFREAVEATTKKIAKQLGSLAEGATMEEIESLMMYNLYTDWDERYVRKQRRVINKFIKEAYKSFRTDASAIFGAADAIPEPVFNLVDIRVQEFFKANDELYLGKFITDTDTRTRITGWIKEQYINNSVPIGADSKGLKMFAEQFGDVVGGEQWKVRRIIDTTVSSLRTAGAVSYIHQAEVEQFKILSLKDGLRCSYCAALQGAVFSTKIEYERIEKITSSAPELAPELKPFVTASGLTPDKIKEMKWTEVQSAGIGSPPYHCHCRCTVVADL